MLKVSKIDTDLTSDEIWEEVICDSLAEKNGKGNTSRADVLRKKIRDLEKMNAVSESIILNLEATKHIKRLLERERKAFNEMVICQSFKNFRLSIEKSNYMW